MGYFKHPFSLYKTIYIAVCYLPSLLLLPRLGLWSRDKAAKGIAVVAIVVVGRIDVATIEDEAVGAVSSRAGPRRPVITVLASAAKPFDFISTNPPAPHKE